MTFPVQRFHMWHVLFSRRLTANFAEHSAPYNADKSIEFVVNNLEKSSATLFTWLSNNCTKVNTGKIHLLASGNVKATAKINNNFIKSGKTSVII